MKKLFSILLTMAIVISLLAVGGVAAGVLSVTPNNNNVSVVFSGAEDGAAVTFTVIAPTDTLPAGPFVLHREMTVAGGSVSFSFTLPSLAPSGTYIVRASYNRVLYEVMFEFESPVLLQTINSAANATVVLNALERYGETIGLDIPLFMLMDRAYRLRVAERILAERGTGYIDNNAIVQAYDVAFALVSVQFATPGGTGVFSFLEVMRRNSAIFRINLDAPNGDFMRLTPTMRAQYEIRMAGSDFATVGDLQNASLENTIIAFFREATWPGIQTYNQFSASALLDFDYGIRYTTLNDQSLPLRAVVAGRTGIQTVADINRLREEGLAAAYEAQGNPQQQRPPGGGSGGGGFGGPPPNMTVVGGVPGEPGLNPIPPDYELYVFNDLTDAEWAIDYITELYELEIVNGIGGGMFAPNAQVTREQFLRMTVLAFGFEITDGETEFGDVVPDAWYARYVKAAVEAGITVGISETEFGTGLSISRQDLVVMIHRALLADGVEFDEAEELTFYDSYMVAYYAVEAMSVMVDIGIISGMGGNELAPTANATRAQAARIIALAMWI